MPAKKILIPLDNSSISEQIVPIVQGLFQPDDVDLVLFSVAQPKDPAQNSHHISMPYSSYMDPLDYPGTYDMEEWHRQLERERESLETGLHALQRRLQAAGYSISTVIQTGDPVQQIVTYAKDGGFDLLAMATHGRSGISRFMFGSVAEKVLRNVPIPVLLLRPTKELVDNQTPGEKLAKADSEPQHLNFVVAIDGTPRGQQALAQAWELQQAMNAQLKLLVTVDSGVGANQAQHMMQATLAELDRLQVKPETIPLVGRTDVNVERFVTENPTDLLIISPFKDKTASSTAAIGSSVRQIVQYAPTSILIAKGHVKKTRKILACVAPGDTVVLDVAKKFAAALAADLSVLHVWTAAAHDEPVLIDTAELLSRNRVVHRQRERQTGASSGISSTIVDPIYEDSDAPVDLMKTIAEIEESGVDSSAIRVGFGPVVESILYVANEEQPDLIVVGSQSGPGYFTGSAASGVVERASQSVLVVRTNEI